MKFWVFFFFLFHENHNHISKSCIAFEIGGLLHSRSTNVVTANINLCKVNKFKLCQSRMKWHMKSGDTSRQHTIFMPFWINNIYRSSGREKKTEQQIHTRENTLKIGLVSSHQLSTFNENWFDEFCCCYCCCCFNTYFYSCISIAKLHSITTFSASRSLRVGKYSFCDVRFMHLFKRHFSF